MTLAHNTLPERRRPLLKQMLDESRLLRAIECHSPLSAMLGSTAHIGDGVARAEFEVLWASGFSHATVLGLPDAEISILERRLDSIADIAAMTAKPILVDADTGGDGMALGYLCRRLEALGVSGVIVEDKAGAKRTSLAEGVTHELEAPCLFVEKLAVARTHLLTQDMLIFARIESLIAGAGMEDALSRAEQYLRSSADGVVIHSKDKTGAEVLAFMQGFGRLQSALGIAKPLVCIPTAYNHLTGAQLFESGARMIIYGNHMVRAAYRGMQLAAHSILKHDRSFEANALCTPVDELFETIGVS